MVGLFLKEISSSQPMEVDMIVKQREENTVQFLNREGSK